MEGRSCFGLMRLADSKRKTTNVGNQVALRSLSLRLVYPHHHTLVPTVSVGMHIWAILGPRCRRAPPSRPASPVLLHGVFPSAVSTASLTTRAEPWIQPQLSSLIPLLSSPCLPAGAKGKGRLRDVRAWARWVMLKAISDHQSGKFGQTAFPLPKIWERDRVRVDSGQAPLNPHHSILHHRLMDPRSESRMTRALG